MRSLARTACVTPRTDDNELWKAMVVFPGLAEGPGVVTGTIRGKTVFGDAMVEVWNPTP